MVCGLAADSDSVYHADNRLPTMRLSYGHATSLFGVQQSLSMTKSIFLLPLKADLKVVGACDGATTQPCPTEITASPEIRL